MAVAFGGEGEIEGVVTGVAAAVNWCDAELFEEVGGHRIELRRAVGAERIKVEATPSPLTDFKFTKQFDDEQLRLAGFSRRMSFADCIQVIGDALKGNETMTATLSADESGDGLFLHITVTLAHFLAEYKLPLDREPVALSDKLTVELSSFKQQLAAVRIELEQSKLSLRDSIAVSEAFKQQLAEVKAESERRGVELKAMAKAKAAADRSAADDSRELKSADESDTRKKAKITTSFRFDKFTNGGKMRDGITPKTDPSKWDVSADGKCATAKQKNAQMMISPPLRSDSQMTIEVLKKGSGYIGVGVTDDYSHWLSRGCEFYSDGYVFVKGSDVARRQAFGDWHSGDRLFVTANLSSGTVSIRTPNGEFTQKWTPSSSPIWFAVYSNDAGTKLRIID